MDIRTTLKETGKVNIIEVQANDFVIDEPALIEQRKPNMLNILAVEFSSTLPPDFGFASLFCAYKKFASENDLILFRNYEVVNDAINQVSIDDYLTTWYNNSLAIEDIYSGKPVDDHLRNYINLDKMYCAIFNPVNPSLSLDDIVTNMPMPNPLGVSMTKPIYEAIMQVYAARIHNHLQYVNKAIDLDHFVYLSSELAGARYNVTTTEMTLHSYFLFDPESEA